MLTPNITARSSFAAATIPLLAMLIAYLLVVFVRAQVLVYGTAEMPVANRTTDEASLPRPQGVEQHGNPTPVAEVFQRTAVGTPKEEFAHEHIHDVHAPEWIAWVPMLVLIFVLGIVPGLIFGMTDDVATTIASAFGG